ncbi:MAG: hypothetical protein ACERKV_05485 [Clostridiaceae bacterium]
MNYNKAMKKQNKSYRRYMLFLSFISLLLPFVLIIFKIYNSFFILYLVVIEIIIVITLILFTNINRLSLSKNNNKIRITQGIFGEKYYISADKVVLVHVENGEEINIVLVCTSRFRNKKIKKVDNDFLKRHGYISHMYTMIKSNNPEENYYYLIIKNGGLKKYKVLDMIYTSCVYAKYTEEAIDKIKVYRDSE